MKIKALNNNSLIKPIFIRCESDSVLDIPDEQTDTALVIESSDKDLIDKTIMYDYFGLKEFFIDGEKHYFIKNENILGICE